MVKLKRPVRKFTDDFDSQPWVVKVNIPFSVGKLRWHRFHRLLEYLSKLLQIMKSQVKCGSPKKNSISLMMLLESSRMATFKAPKKVLSEASSFFEKLLNSDLKESKEGVVRLEMFTDSVMRSTSEFIYTGNIQILDDDTRDLVMIADYLFLQRLKTPWQRIFWYWNWIFHIVFQFSILLMNITARNLPQGPKHLPLQFSAQCSLWIVDMFWKCPAMSYQCWFQAMSYMLAFRKMFPMSF